VGGRNIVESCFQALYAIVRAFRSIEIRAWAIWIQFLFRLADLYWWWNTYI